MVWLIGSVLLALVFGAVALAAKAGAFKEHVYGGEIKNHGGGVTLITGVVIAILFVVLTAFSSYHQVPAGHVGLVYEFGAIVGETQDGPQFVRPWRSVRAVNVQVQSVRFHSTNEKDDISHGLTQIAAASAETQNIFVDATINYQVDRGTVSRLYREVGPGWFERLIPSRVQQFFKAEIVKYGAVDVTTHREHIREDVTQALDTELAPYGISIVAVQVDNIGYSDEFDRAIESKQVATQNALQAEEVVKQREAEARQQVAQAKGAADAAIEKARGDAESITINANAQAAANRELAQSISPDLIRYRAIEKLQDTKVAILPSGSGYLLDPSTVLGSLSAP